jgi:hypothetical protein
MFDGNIKTNINLLLLVVFPQILSTQNKGKTGDWEKTNTSCRRAERGGGTAKQLKHSH